MKINRKTPQFFNVPEVKIDVEYPQLMLSDNKAL